MPMLFYSSRCWLFWDRDRESTKYANNMYSIFSWTDTDYFVIIVIKTLPVGHCWVQAVSIRQMGYMSCLLQLFNCFHVSDFRDFFFFLIKWDKSLLIHSLASKSLSNCADALSNSNSNSYDFVQIIYCKNDVPIRYFITLLMLTSEVWVKSKWNLQNIIKHQYSVPSWW